MAVANVRPELHWSARRLQFALERLSLSLKAYNPDQPRAPVGTEEGGQWISANSNLEPIVLAGGFEKEHMGMTVRDFVSQNCIEKINRRVPGEFWNLTIEELLQAKRGSAPGADRCYKLLNQNRFR